MRTTLLGVVYTVVAVHGLDKEGPIADQAAVVAPLAIGVGHEAAAGIDCRNIYDCDSVPYDPVCGSDGVTYSNDCTFVTKFCAEMNDADLFFIQATGECSLSSEDEDKDHENGFVTFLSDLESNRVLDAELATSETKESVENVDPTTVFCSLTCKLTRDEVCGNDGVTYINDCHLLSSKCEHPELEKASHGACSKRPHDNVVLSALEADAAQDSPAPLQKCNPMCERVYDPMCGSDGITYANLCLLEYAECRNPNVKVFMAGKCPPHMKIARIDDFVNLENDEEVCIPGPCPYTYAPVCGSDGQTYDNLCLFANAKCQHPQYALTVVHDGECDANTQLTCETMTCPTFTECLEQIEPDGIVVAYCADVCSSDRCGEREDCKLIDSACYTAPCSPIAMCVPKVQDG